MLVAYAAQRRSAPTLDSTAGRGGGVLGTDWFGLRGAALSQRGRRGARARREDRRPPATDRGARVPVSVRADASCPPSWCYASAPTRQRDRDSRRPRPRLHATTVACRHAGVRSPPLGHLRTQPTRCEWRPAPSVSWVTSFSTTSGATSCTRLSTIGDKTSTGVLTSPIRRLRSGHVYERATVAMKSRPL